MRRLYFAILTGILLLTFAPIIHAQTSGPGNAGSTWTGWLHLITGDPPRDGGGEGQLLIVLQDDSGTNIAEIRMDENTARELSGQRVLIAGNPDAPQNGQSVAPVVIDAQSVQALPAAPSDLSSPAAEVSGSQPWVNIICRFPNISGYAHEASWYGPLFGNVYPGLDHYWRQLSYNKIDLTGTTTLSKIYVLPQPRSFYISPQLNLDKLAQDCTKAANPDVYFPNFVGINIMLNGDLDCCAYGGSTTFSLDGQQRSYRVTWLPPWAQEHSTIAHEMGHGFGFPHSTGPSWNPPSGLDIYISQWDVMSSSGGTCADFNFEYGCVAPGTIAYHLDMDKWIPTSREPVVLVGEDETITLEQISLPQSTTNALMAKVPIGNSSRKFYTVEVRRFDGYDQSVPGEAVIIHDVFTERQGNGGHALVVDNDTNLDVNDAGAMWLPGETFTDSTNNISVQVLSAGATSFTVRIINNSTPTLEADPPTNWRTSADDDGITIEWDDSSYNELGFKIYRWNGSIFAQLATVGSNVTSYTNSGLGCGIQQYYQVTSYTSADESERDDFTWTVGMTNPCVPDLQSPANGANSSTGQMTLRWDDSLGAETFEVSISPTTTPAVYASGINATSYTASGLPDGLYYWQVRAVNDLGGISDWSEQRTFTIVSPAGAAPQRNFVDTPTLTWNRITWADGYHVQVARDANFNEVVYTNDTLSAATLSVTPPLTAGTYYWHVRAIDNGTWRSWSATERISVE